MPNGRCTSRESATQVWQPILEPDCHTKSHRHRDCHCYCFRLLSLFSPFYVSLSLCFSLQDVRANLRARRSHQDPSTDLNLTWTRRPFFLSLCLCVSKVQESPVQRRKIIKHLYIRLTDFHFPKPTIWDNLLLFITIFQDTLPLGLWKRRNGKCLPSKMPVASPLGRGEAASTHRWSVTSHEELRGAAW